jgi:hypothetical protein
MPLEPPDQQYRQAAIGYVELGMFAEADSELEKLTRFVVRSPKFSPKESRFIVDC